MRAIRFALLIFGVLVLLSSAILAVVRHQSMDALWKIVFTQRDITDNTWRTVEIFPTGQVFEKPTSLNGDLLWSPNNEWVAFFTPDGFTRDLTVARPDGSERRVLLENVSQDFTPSWSPDSEWIYYENQISPETYNLARVRITDGHIETYEFGDRVSCCRWSADGEWVLIRLRIGLRQYHIVRVRADFSEQQTVFSTNDDFYTINIPEFAGNDEWIIFVADHRRDGSLVYRIRPDGSDLEAIAAINPPGNPVMQVSNDGEWVALVENTRSGRKIQLTRLRIDNTQHDVIFLYEHIAGLGIIDDVWSPDGRYMLFFTWPFESLLLREVNVKTGEITLVHDLKSSYFVNPHYLAIEFEEWRGGWWMMVVSGAIAAGSCTLRKYSGNPIAGIILVFGKNRDNGSMV